MKKEYIINCLLLVTLIASTGCASIVDGRKKKVRIESTPPATVTVLDHKGATVLVTNTPAVVRLKRQAGYFSKEEYKLRFEAPGYYPSEVPLKTNLNVWYLGNILFGGVIGFVFVDPATGANATTRSPPGCGASGSTSQHSCCDTLRSELISSSAFSSVSRRRSNTGLHQRGASGAEAAELADVEQGRGRRGRGHCLGPDAPAEVLQHALARRSGSWRPSPTAGPVRV